MGRVGVGDTLLPTEGGHPACRLVETMLRLGQGSLVPGYVQLNADGSCERFIHRTSIVQAFKNVKGRRFAARFSSRRLKADGSPNGRF
jgi:hypothetical protein